MHERPLADLPEKLESCQDVPQGIKKCDQPKKCPPMVLLAEPRGGSTMTASLLNQNPAVRSGGEALYSWTINECRNGKSLLRSDRCTFEGMITMLAQYLNKVCMQNRECDSDYVGAKIKMGQVPYGMFLDFTNWLY